MLVGEDDSSASEDGSPQSSEQAEAEAARASAEASPAVDVKPQVEGATVPGGRKQQQKDVETRLRIFQIWF